MYINRIYDDLERRLQPGKVALILGPRQIGKSTLLKNFLTQTKLKYYSGFGDNTELQETLGSRAFSKILPLFEGYELVVLDEAQKIPHIGEALKIIVDQRPDIKVVATGSASFALAGQVGEPLTGRKLSLSMFPISVLELLSTNNSAELTARIPEFLMYGMYPNVLTAPTREAKLAVLNDLLDSYLLKDILELEQVKGSKLLKDLLRLVAFQVGNEVSIAELCAPLEIDRKTAARYLDLLEKSYILYNVRGFSRNLRKEITKKSKYYFYDVGIRNSLIANWNEMSLRNDVGALWENFIFMERLKKRTYTNERANEYFWRTWDQAELDLVEERGGKVFGYEIKWRETAKPPRGWLETYPEATFQTINQDNWLDFVL